MRRGLIIATVCMGIAAFAVATSVPPIPLNDRVKTAEHVFVAVASDLQVLDVKGNVMTNAPDSTHIELSLRITVTPKRVLKTSLTNFPDKVVFAFGRGFPLDVRGWKDFLLGKEWVYLLSGSDFHSVHALQFCEPVEKEEEITGYLKGQRLE